MSQRKLLLADDSITIQKVVNLTFADEGIEVITVGDGDSAMEKIYEVTPDLVMADVNMPGLNGYEVCEKIRQTDNLKDTPVLLLVGSFEPFDESEADRVGADGFLTKPFQSIRQLVNKVNDLLQNPPSRNVETAELEEDLANANTISNYNPSEEYAAPDYAATLPNINYGDTGMDDEMIQASSVSSYALDESPKFETKEVSEAEDVGKTQPLSAEDLKQFSFTGYSHQETEPLRVEAESVNEETDSLNETSEFVSTEPESVNVEAGHTNVESESESVEAEFASEETESTNVEAESISEDVEPVSVETEAEDIESKSTSEDDDLVNEEAEPVNAETESINVEAEAEEEAEPITAEASAATETEETSDKEDLNEQAAYQYEEGPEEMAVPQTAEIPVSQPVPVLAEDDDDLLEIPFDEEEEEEEIPAVAVAQPEQQSYAQPEQPSADTASIQNAKTEEFSYPGQFIVSPPSQQTEEIPAVATQNENVEAAPVAAATQLSPELIEAIAQRVVEKLSDRAVKDVAWEVVPQMADLIIKKMAEEKLKE